MTSNKVFTVIIGDLVRSRRLRDRVAFSRKISSSIAKTNDLFKNDLYAPLVITRGIDEFSGILYSPSKAYRIYQELSMHLYPGLIRIAVVTGTLDVRVRSKNARMIDGPAFHLASDLVRKAKTNRRVLCS
jgi:hypothetical protein